MRIYTIVGGVNGVGKSSFIGVLKGQRNDLGVLTDTEENIEKCLEMGVSFTQETTLSGAKTLKTIRRAIEKNYIIRLYYVGVSSSEESLRRIKNRVEKGGHDIPKDDVIRRYKKRYDDLRKVMPYCNEVYFYDNENGFVEVAEYQNGEIIIKSKNPPEWIKNI